MSRTNKSKDIQRKLLMPMDVKVLLFSLEKFSYKDVLNNIDTLDKEIRIIAENFGDEKMTFVIEELEEKLSKTKIIYFNKRKKYKELIQLFKKYYDYKPQPTKETINESTPTDTAKIEKINKLIFIRKISILSKVLLILAMYCFADLNTSTPNLLYAIILCICFLIVDDYLKSLN